MPVSSGPPRSPLGRTALLIVLLGTAGPALAAPEPADPDEELLRRERVGTDGASLLEFLRARTPTEADLQKLAELVRSLGSKSFAQRERASAALARAGRSALPHLRQGAASPDAEIARRARECLERIEEGTESALI